MKIKTLIFILITMALITINPRINGWNEASRMALTQSLVENHSLNIDASVFANTGDKVFIDGYFYSDKPPLPSLIASVVYWPLYHMGWTLDYGWNLSYFLIILLTVKLSWILATLAFYKALTYTPVLARERVWLSLIFAFASLSFSWSATFNNHSLAASSLMIAFMYYLKGMREEGIHAFIWSGLFFGLATAMDMPTGVFMVGFGILVYKRWSFHSNFMAFTAPMIIPIGIHFSINYSIGHTLIPLQMVPEFFSYEGSAWLKPSALSGVQGNSLFFTLQYGLKSLLGVRGFLWYNPLLLLLIPLLWLDLRTKQKFQQESWVILSASLTLMAYYFVFSSNYGGWSYSIRWFVPLLPFFYFYLYDLKHILKLQWGKPIIWGLLTSSIIIAMIGLINPWSNLDIHSIPIIANLQQLLGISQ